MNNSFRSDRDRQQDRSRWTEQGQTGDYYGADQERDRERGHQRNSPYAQGQGGYADRRDDGYGQHAQDRGPSQGQSGHQSGGNWGGAYGGWSSSQDDWNTRSAAQSSHYGQANMGPSGSDQGRAQGMGSGGWSQGQSRPQAQYGQSGASGQQAQRRSDQHHDFEPDYLHWREQQMSNYDRDYRDWRDEKRQRFSSDFEGWRSSRGPQVQAENSVVGDVTDGGGGSQTHAKELHENKPAKH